MLTVLGQPIIFFSLSLVCAGARSVFAALGGRGSCRIACARSRPAHARRSFVLSLDGEKPVRRLFFGAAGRPYAYGPAMVGRSWGSSL